MSDQKNACEREVPCSAITVGDRIRKDMRDLRALAESIERQGLLHPIGITENYVLVFGERRLRAVRDILHRPTIEARIVHVTSILEGERDENELRENFAFSERVAIADALRSTTPERRGKANLANPPELKGRLTRDIAAEKAGLGSGRTYVQAKKVVAKGIPELVAAMDARELSVDAAGLIAEGPRDQQAKILASPAAERKRLLRDLRAQRSSDRERGSGAALTAEPPRKSATALTERQRRVNAAAKARLINALSQIRGLCDNLSAVKLECVRAASSDAELNEIAGIAAEAAKSLRLFSANITALRRETAV